MATFQVAHSMVGAVAQFEVGANTLDELLVDVRHPDRRDFFQSDLRDQGCDSPDGRIPPLGLRDDEGCGVRRDRHRGHQTAFAVAHGFVPLGGLTVVVVG
jgi:hypothetical protein